MKFKQNLAVAHALLSVLREMYENSRLKEKVQETKTSLWVECFDNCREQGYVLTVWGNCKPLRIAFSEHRNCDSIVVYCYEKTKHPSNLPAEGEWEDNKHFTYGKYDEAADYIFKRINQHINTDGDD